MSFAPETPELPEVRRLEVPADLVPLVDDLAAKMRLESPEDALLLALGTLSQIIDHEALVLLVSGHDVKVLCGPVDNGVKATDMLYFTGSGITVELLYPSNPRKTK
jgi:hypothetical protein